MLYTVKHHGYDIKYIVHKQNYSKTKLTLKQNLETNCDISTRALIKQAKTSPFVSNFASKFNFTITTVTTRLLNTTQAQPVTYVRCRPCRGGASSEPPLGTCRTHPWGSAARQVEMRTGRTSPVPPASLSPCLVPSLPSSTLPPTPSGPPSVAVTANTFTWCNHIWLNWDSVYLFICLHVYSRTCVTVEPVLGDHLFGPAKAVSQDRWSLITGTKIIFYPCMCMPMKTVVQD